MARKIDRITMDAVAKASEAAVVIGTRIDKVVDRVRAQVINNLLNRQPIYPRRKHQRCRR